jgi:ribosomal-protein-alanine N-acetyltransferase
VAQASIHLRPVNPGDSDPLHELLSRWDVVRYMLIPLCSRQDSETFVRDAQNESAGSPWRSIVRAIVEQASGRLVGLCGIAILQGTEEGEIWYLIHPDSWGRGAATSAARELLKFGFTELGLHRIWACCLPENPASARVLEKAGLRREGYCHKNLKIHGEWKDSYLYAILAEEWRGFSSTS